MQKTVQVLQSVALTLASITSGSAQWQQVTSGTIDSLTVITWVEDRFFIAGGNLVLLRSFDNGISFSATSGFVPGFDPAPMNHLAFHDGLMGYGTNTLSCCALQRTLDGGLTWASEIQNGPSDVTVMRLPLNNADQVVFRNGAAVQFGADGRLLVETAATIFADLDSVCPIPDEGVCWVTGTGTDAIYTTGSHGWTLTSNDRGATIQSGTFPYGYYVYSAHVINGDTVAYVDFDRDLLMSYDKGVSWMKRGVVPFHVGLITPAFRMWTSAKGAACDSTGQINLTEDSGTTWFPVPTPTTMLLHDMLFVDADNVLAVGDAGTILSSSDGGYTWAIEESGTTERLHALATSGTATLAIGTNGTILRRFPAHSGLGLSTTVVDHFDDGPKLFPNPASTTLDVRFLHPAAAGEPRFTIVDALGRPHLVAARRADTGVWQMDITQLTQGIHTLHVSMDKAVWKRNFLVIR